MEKLILDLCWILSSNIFQYIYFVDQHCVIFDERWFKIFLQVVEVIEVHGSLINSISGTMGGT